MSHACPWWSPPSPSEWALLPALPTTGRSCAPGGDVGSCGSNPAGPFSLRVECSGSKRGRAAFPPGEAWKPCHMGGPLGASRAGSQKLLRKRRQWEGKSAPSASACSVYTPPSAPPRSSRLFQSSPGLYLCPSRARIEKAVRKEFRQKETCWRDASFFPRKYNLFLTASSYAGLTL